MEKITTINSGRRIALRQDEKYIHIMKYMGSKRELLPDIREEVGKVAKENEGILDIFAGTGSVGLYLKDKYNIVSNDIQAYSSVICDGLISSNKINLKVDVEEQLKEIKKHFNKNKKELTKILENTLEESKEFVSIEKRGWKESQRKKYVKFVESFPNPVNKFKGKNPEQEKLYQMYLDRNKKPNLFPFMQTVFLFAETYFSLEQCIDIDSIRYAIEKTFQDDEIEKNVFLTALLYAHSYCSSGTGHFAMYRDLKSVDSVNDSFLYRGRSAMELFEKKLNEIVEFHEYTPKKKHESVSMDYKEILNNKKVMNKVKVIYADPPYSFVHYSRFYHAPESLIKYDYNVPKFKGRYRTDRHQSPFCQKTNVREAFNELFKATAENDKYCILSYADTGMISMPDILEIIKENGLTYTIKEVDYDHSTMGREGHKSNVIKEYLITAIPPVHQ